MTRARTLTQLQQIDSARDAVQRRLAAIQDELEDRGGMAAAKEDLAAAEEQLAEIERQLRGNDLERRGLRERATGEEAKLYTGRVKSPKELQNLQLEVSSLKKRLAEFEDVSLSLMLQRDEAQAAAEECRRRVGEMEAASLAQNEAFTAERADLEHKLRALDHKRADVAGQLTPAELATYDRLRPRKGGVAVAQLKGTDCAVCGIQLPRSAADTVRTADRMSTCPGCGRILLP